MTRPTPKENAVRETLKEEREELAGANSGSDDGKEAVVESAAPAEEAVEEQDELTVAKRERDEYLDLAKRTQADFENFRKRAAKDMQASGARARIGLIREILPVVDNLERALSVAPAGDGDAFVEGVRLVYRDLEGALARAGVEAIEPKGDAFDPNVHEALSVRPQDGAESGTVVDVVEKGYRTSDTVVRPARVVVAA
ncbi:MAG: molecular chaperone GrpE [Thermoleophilaceae bacterium]|nr:molecular chaperone GrpE [Thermoleophilaceae bacterium]